LPTSLILLGSAVILFHLGAVVVQVLAAPSGPWPMPMGGASPALPPQFAQSASEVTARHYLRHLKMTHNYHFVANEPAQRGVYLEARLKDPDGKVVKTLRFPDPDANFWVRHRQTLLAQWLTQDVPVEARPGEVIAAPGQKAPSVDIWDMTNPAERVLRIKTVPEHLVPRDRPVFRPSPWSILMARAYARYLRREYGAASVEVLRHTREAIGPEAMFGDGAPPNAFDELISSFGEFTR
jgi:hypothetical protein